MGSAWLAIFVPEVRGRVLQLMPKVAGYVHQALNALLDLEIQDYALLDIIVICLGHPRAKFVLQVFSA